ncbi:hypothetical protein BIW11_10777 [Tropilaelaps mercedesae]|uniref:ATP-dependent helicase ATRX n=1 Tax=Tropilaelaps mercedesae TaxID=418985 RepID=A0A1V9XE37_9ACAR|nr:hypothetical protein BIW11_10777 [Tropilaelaps mercedesae]
MCLAKACSHFHGIEMSSSSDEDEAVHQLNGDVEGVSRDAYVPLLQYSSTILPATSVTPAFLERHQAVCTACRTRVSHLNTRRLRVHPTLCTIVCRKCEEKLSAVYMSSDGIDGNRCQWCVTPLPQDWEQGNCTASVPRGGARCCHSQCRQYVCRLCLRQNLTREQIDLVRKADEKGEWRCFRCDAQTIRPHQLYAATIAEYMRIRRRPVLLSMPPDDKNVNQEAVHTSPGTNSPSCNQRQEEIELLANSAQSVVVACALHRASPDGQSNLINQLEKLILLAPRFMNIPPDSVNDRRSLPAAMTLGETSPDTVAAGDNPRLNVNDKRSLIDVVHEQRQRQAPQTQQQEGSYGPSVNASKDSTRENLIVENISITSLDRVPNPSESDRSVTDIVEDVKGTLDVIDAATTTEDQRWVLAEDQNATAKKEISAEVSTNSERPDSPPEKSAELNVVDAARPLSPLNVEDNGDSRDSNATVDLPVIPNKKYSKQRVLTSLAKTMDKRTSEAESDEERTLNTLLAGIQRRRVVHHQDESSQQAGTSRIAASSEAKPKTNDSQGKIAKSSTWRRLHPFASSSEEEEEEEEKSETGHCADAGSQQPRVLEPIIVHSDCDGLSDSISDIDNDNAFDVCTDEDDSDGGGASQGADARSGGSSIGGVDREAGAESAVRGVDERDAENDRERETDLDDGEALSGQKKKILQKRSVSSIPVAERVDDDGASSSSDDCRDADPATAQKRSRPRFSLKRRLISLTDEESSGGDRKKARVSSEKEFELSPVRPTSSSPSEAGKRFCSSASIARGKANSSSSGTGNISTVAKKNEPEHIVLLDSDEDDDVIVSKQSTLRKQTSIERFVSPKKFAKQIIKEELDPFVISSDEESSQCTQVLDPPSTPNGIRPKEEIPTPSGINAGRRNIREVMDENKLSLSTREANFVERERRQRIEELQKKYNQFEQSTEDAGPDVGKCVLEYDLETKEPLVEVHTSLARRLKSHQRDGIKFLYGNLIETVARLKTKWEGTGAILAHCMGLGKTFQVICLMHTLLTHQLLKEYFKTILIVCPLNVINAWRCEVHQWVGRDNTIKEKFMLYNLHNEKDSSLRVSLLSKWARSGGVLLITPSLLTALLGGETEAGQRKHQRKKDISAANKSLTKRVKHNAVILQKFKNFLCHPGASVVVVDEGHTLKKSDTQVTQIVQMMDTRRKILLTGTPLQNNLTEYYTMVSLVAPDLLGTKTEFKNRFENPIINGQYKNSTSEDIRKMRRRASVLNQLLNNVVQRRDTSVLASILPPRQDYVITIRLSPLQERLYSEFLGMLIKLAEDQAGTSGPTFRRLLQDYVLLRSTWTHPKLLTMPQKTCSKKQTAATVSDMLTFDSITPELDAQLSHKDWYKPHLEGKDLDDIALGPKLFILFDIIQQCALIGDKLVVFCTQLSALDLIEYLLKLMHENKIGVHGWIKDLDFFRMDGSTNAEDRQRFFGLFNDPNQARARLFLVSTNAGKLGSTLTGANRMVLLDTSWNPSDDNQAVYRIYRIGQLKPVYIYRFVSLGTMEEKIYARNILKESTGHRVLDDSNMERHFTHEDVRDLYKFTRYEEAEKVVPHVPKDCLLAELILRHKDNIVKVHEHQQMLQNLEDDLSQEDRRVAWEEYQREKDAPPGAHGSQGPPGVAAIVRPPPMLYVAQQLLGQVGQYRAIFWDEKTAETVQRDMVGLFLKKTKQAKDKFEEVSTLDQKTLAECIRTGQPPEVTDVLVQRIQLANSKIGLLHSELTQINQFLTMLTRTPIKRL